MPEKLGADMIVGGAGEEAERGRAGLTILTDGSRVGSGASGYPVVGKKGERRASIKTHMGFNQEAFDWREHWKWQGGDGLSQKKSPYSPTRRPQSQESRRTNRGRASDTPQERENGERN